MKGSGWGGRIRTSECRNQNPVSYRLTTPQQKRRQPFIISAVMSQDVQYPLAGWKDGSPEWIISYACPPFFFAIC